MPKDCESATIQIRDAQGNFITNLPINEMGKGQIFWTAFGYPNGVYHYTLFVDDEAVETKQMILKQ